MKKVTLFWLFFILLVLGGGLYYRYSFYRVDERGATLLMRGFESNSSNKDVLRLIKRSDDLNVRDKAGRTALFYAARYTQDVNVLKKMLAEGAEVSVVDQNGQTALMQAARYNTSPEVVSLLAQLGGMINVTDKMQNSALFLAARHNNAAVIKELLRHGADPDLKGEDGRTAAQLLTENENLTDEEKTDYRQAMLIVSILRPIEK
jgi:ankyrin repeat protein